MAKPTFSPPSPQWLPAGICFALLVCSVSASGLDRKVYIVYMGERLKGASAAESVHFSMMEQVVGSSASEHLLHSYKRSFSGFVAKLTDEEMKIMSSMDGVVSVFPNRNRKLHTTRSWNFMGFPVLAERAPLESDIIVGMLDTGIWPESQSFDDRGFGPPPAKWKGICQSPTNFTCNNKIIGARYYNGYHFLLPGEILSPRDSHGHGTHTASTAAGRQVVGANLGGLAEGTARGGVPSARIAVYKICWAPFGCAEADILAAFDDAIADGVDIISLSVGGRFLLDYFTDPIAIGAFHAMKNGILTSNSAGNSGPFPGTVENYSPWSLTVAASTINRRFVSRVNLGNGAEYEGSAINTFDLGDGMHPLIYAGDAPNASAGYSSNLSRYCVPGSLDKRLVGGKIVLCDSLSWEVSSGALRAGALGAIVQTSFPYMKEFADVVPLPATLLGMQDGGNISLYVNSTSQPMANILRSQEEKDPRAPFVVFFSSRGPNRMTPNILKPDLTAPGVDILAAWSPMSPPSGNPDDMRSVSYNIISGTSMSCPHATGAAAYVKSFHPSWSPAAIKSALMTTAFPMDPLMNTDTEFAYGAGHINPQAAVKPGLVYDADEGDYVRMLCGQGYNATTLRLLTGDHSTCTSSNNGTVYDLNYPSFALAAASGTPFSVIFHRTVTNVGFPNSTYTGSFGLLGSSELGLRVTPRVLSFQSVGQKMSFTLTLQGQITVRMPTIFLTWNDGVHSVRSPIVVYLSMTK